MSAGLPKYYYKVCVNEKWSSWWGLLSSYERDTQELIDVMNSRGWDLHSFSLRNNMLANTGITTSILRLLVRLITLGFMVYQTGGVWVFKKELPKSFSTTRRTRGEPNLGTGFPE